MRLLDSRRLFGPSLPHAAPAVIAEVALEPGEDADRAIEAWHAELDLLSPRLGLATGERTTRRYAGGIALSFVAPLDVLLPATDVNELAIERATAALTGAAVDTRERERATAEALGAARSDALLALASEARRRELPLLLDDATITLGMAARSRSYPRAAPPRPEEVPWAELGRVPVALITGTNGKTTSTRFVARIARAAGLSVGSTSTDGIALDGVIVDAGDYTGPAGALSVLRRPEVELAALETARGGILRRGLAVDRAEAALITNVSEDHLGDYGIDDADAMAEVKAVVSKVARLVVLNAEDARLRALGARLGDRARYFSVDPSRGAPWTVRDGAIVRGERSVVRVDELPLAFGGKARFNVENALGAAALAHALGLPDAAIARGLRELRPVSSDNPGRGNLFVLPGGARVMVDFGHNPAGVSGALELARQLAPALTVIIGMPGDRPDPELAEVARRIALASPRRIFVRELGHYLRGREPGAVPAILRAAFARLGVGERVLDAPDERAALERALAAATPDELIVILPCVDRPEITALLAERGAIPLGG